MICYHLPQLEHCPFHVSASHVGVWCSAILNKMDNDANLCLNLAVQHGHV